MCKVGLFLRTYFHNVFWVGTRNPHPLICLMIYICLGSWLCSKVKARSVERVFEFLKTHSLVLVLWPKRIRMKEPSVPILSKALKELRFSWKNRQRIHGCVVDSLTFLKTVDIHENWFFELTTLCLLGPSRYRVILCVILSIYYNMHTH
jgi:hypothetical protein